MGGLEAPPMMALRLPDTGGEPLRVLCLGAHADDIEIGCGGTLLTLARTRPLLVHWVVFSADGPRRAEAEAGAAAFLPAGQGHRVEIHAFHDGFFPAQRAALKEAFQEVAAAGDPHVIFTHREGDLHQDHQTLGALARETFRRHLTLGYEIPKYDGDLTTPNLYVALSDEVRHRKVALLMEIFPSQGGKPWFEPATFEGLMRLRGLECAAPGGYAEGFHLRKARLEP